MIVANLILATAGLLHAASARTINVERQASPGPIFPSTKKDFSKDGVAAKWAPGHPKEWGQEDFKIQFNKPHPEDNFDATVTPDQKFLAIYNGTHVQLTDLDKNATASTFALQPPANHRGRDLIVRARAQGGYDFLISTGQPNNNPINAVRQRLGADLQPIGPSDLFDGGIGSISSQGHLATKSGQIYDLESSSSGTAEIAVLEGASVTDLSFSPDGVHLASVNWNERTADLWNATSGAKILAFPPTGKQNWLVRISPDGKYVAISFGSGEANDVPNNAVQVYTLADVAAGPFYLLNTDGWPREITWSEDSKRIAVGDAGRVRIYDVASKSVLNEWHVDAVENVYLPSGTQFLDGGKKFTWTWRDGKYLYDFETNTEWLWTVSRTDHHWGYERFFLLEKKGYVITADGDSTVRFWKL